MFSLQKKHQVSSLEPFQIIKYHQICDLLKVKIQWEFRKSNNPYSVLITQPYVCKLSLLPNMPRLAI